MPVPTNPGEPVQPAGAPGADMHWDGTRWLHWDGQAWIPATPETPATPQTPSAPPMPTATSSGNPWRTGLIVLCALLLLAGGVVGGVLWARRGDTGTTTTAGPPIGTGVGVTSSDIVTVPVNTAVNPFTPPAGTDQSVTPAAVTAPTVVAGGEVGLYGGTMDIASCDREQLVSFLAATPDKAAAWAGVLDIPPATIPTYVRGLTPVLLRSDTLVINHGFENGVATSFTSVLQAGTAVLVNDRGRPVVRCYCGNPLTAAPTRIAAPVYTGPTWPAWNPASIIVIIENTTVITDFTIINITTGQGFTRPTGTAGASDSDSPGTVTPTPTTTPSQEPTPDPTSAATRPEGPVENIFEIASIAGVSSRPTKKSTFTVEQGVYITSIVNYHYLNNGSGPGTIGLRSSDGTMYGPWRTTGSEGQGGVPNAYWTATPNIVIEPGTYTVVDSNPGTWSWAPDTGGRGMTRVDGIWTVQGP